MTIKIYLTAVINFDDDDDAVYADAASAGPAFEKEVSSDILVVNGVGNIDDRLGILDQAPIRSAISFSFTVGARKFSEVWTKEVLPRGWDRARVIVLDGSGGILFRGVITSHAALGDMSRIEFSCENLLDSSVRKVLPLTIPAGTRALEAARLILLRTGAVPADVFIPAALEARDYAINTYTISYQTTQVSSISVINILLRPVALYLAENIEGQFFLADRVITSEPVATITTEDLVKGSVRVRNIIEAAPLNGISYTLPAITIEGRGNFNNTVVNVRAVDPAVKDVEMYTIEDLVSGANPSGRTTRALKIFEYAPNLKRF